MTNVTPLADANKSHKSTGQRTDLIMGESFQLMKLIESDYPGSGMTDKEFAEFAMTKIALRPGVTIKDHNIKMRRDQMGIANNRAVNKAADSSVLAASVMNHEARIADLEERILKLEIWIKANFPTKGPR